MKKKLLICLLLTVICFWHFNVKAEGIAEAITEDAVASEVISNEEIVGTESETEEESDDDEEETVADEEELVEEKEEDTTDETEKEEETTEEEVTTTDDVEEENNEEGKTEEENTKILENEEGYKVTFINGDYRLDISGGSNILLSGLLENQGINISLSDIDSIRFSNDELLRITKLDNNDYSIESLKPFNTTEKLIIKLIDGNEIVITVLDGAGDAPDHLKLIEDNGDGTYTIELTVTGDADNETQEKGSVNVVVVYDVSQSMSSNAGSSSYSRADQAEDVVHDFLTNLKKYQNADKDNINVSLVTFAVTGSQVQGWTTDVIGLADRFDDGGTNGRVKFRYDGRGTNWESALQRAQALVNNVNNDYPTFVILITDGAPTASGNGNNAIAPTDETPIARFRERYNAATDEAYAIANAVGPEGTFYGIYAYGTEADLLDDLMYYSVNGEHRGGNANMNNVVAATQEAPNYFNAGETAQLQAAIDEIFDKVVQAMGIASVSISDGTTNSVVTSKETIAELLEVDEESYEYWISIPVVDNKFERTDRDGNTITYTVTTSGDNATVTWGSNSVTVEGKVVGGQLKYKWVKNALYNYDVPEAEFVDGAVNWDLSSVGTLLDKVTYSVKFTVYPSQETLDIIADIKNKPGENGAWKSLDSEIKKYIDVNGNLKTNTTATLSYTDTRTGKSDTSAFNELGPVETNAVESIAVTKVWENEIDKRAVDSLVLTVTRDNEPKYEIELSDDNDWTDSVYISIGIIKNGEVLNGSEGHDFTFTEPTNLTYHWELDVPVVHPMLIDGVLTMLIKVDEKHPLPSGATTYTINDATYYVDNAATSLTATNNRRSRLFLTKIVTGENVPEDVSFPFTINVINSKAPATEPTNDPNHDSDYWVWVSVFDADGNGVNEGVENATSAGNGYWYAPSDTDIIIQVKVGYSIMVNNLPTGTTYTITEGTLPTGFIYDKTKLRIVGDGTDSTFIAGLTTTGTIESTNTQYYVDYTNEYALIDISVDKVWDDNSDQDGMRPTTDEFTLTLNGVPNGTTVPTPEITVSEDGNTWTYIWKAVPKYNSDRTKIEYTVTEDNVPEGYTASGSPATDGGVITNTHTPAKANVVVTKVWSDSSNKEGFRPEKITITLYANGEKVTATPTIKDNGDDTWTITYSGLDVYANGEKIVYTIEETQVTNYEEPVYDQKNLKVTNKRTVEYISLTVKKIWDDGDDAEGFRPDEVTVNLLANGKVIDTVTLSENNEWEYSWTELDKYANGSEIKYTVTEDEVDKYETDIEYNEDDDTYTITNTHEIETNDIVVTKVWEDEDNESGKRPESVTIILLANDIEYARVELNEDNDWTHTFEGVPVNDENHKEITYSVSEEVVPKDYEVAYEETEDGFIIHNVLGKGDGNPPENPQTGSNIVLYLIALLISIIGLIGGKHYLKENN